jgi:hypothetical protein
MDVIDRELGDLGPAFEERSQRPAASCITWK